MVRETRNLHPSHLIMLDVRASKSYEEVCIGGSVYASIQNNRITSPQLLRYLELKNSLIPEQDNDRIFTRRNSPAHKPIAFIVLVWDYNTQQQEIGRILKYFLHDLQIKRVCLLKGGVQSFLVDGADALKYKNKVVLPPFIKKEMEDLKSL
jgi:TBC domain-containing protein kinase-like protein